MSQIAPDGPFDASSTENDAPSRVLFIPEIVYHILTFLTRPDNSRNARVCKIWSDIALKSIWREVDDIYAVFSVLGPLEEVHHVSGVHLYAFSEQPTVSSWQRFDKYAAYIRKFVYAPKPLLIPQKLLSHKAMIQISHTRTRLDILPNLNILVWRPHPSAADSFTGSPTLNDGLLFMHSAVTNFTFSHINVVAEPYTNDLLRDIAPRMPYLTQLSFHTSEAVARVESGLTTLAESLQAVTVVRLPAYYLTTRVAEALSVLPHLRGITVGHGIPEDTYPSQPNLEFRPVFLPGSFKSLKSMVLMMHAADATKVISNVPFPSGPRYLHVTFSTTNNPVDVQKLLEACQKHKTVARLHLLPDRSSNRRDLHEGHRSSLEFTHLKSLAQFTMLSHLMIDHPSPLFLSLADVTSIVAALPSLRSLRLNPEPMHPQMSSLGLDVLAVIARSCRHLETLALFIDATLPTQPIPHDLTFQNLVSLAVGPSVINKAACHSTALYISELLPDGCQISYSAWWVEAARRLTHPSAQIFGERFKLWEEVESLLRLLAKATARYRLQQSLLIIE